MSDIRSEPTPFAEVDTLPPHIVGLLHDALQRMAAHPQIQRVRRVALDALRPVPGQRLLDAGAGVGEVARELASLVAPDGSVVALDRSAVTVRAAADRHDRSAVEYVPGDVTALDFPDGSFDGVRCERVLQHVPDPDRAIAELIRVTRSGGRVCLIDTDWDSLALDGLPTDLVGAVREQFARRDMAHHSDMGRTLRRRLVRAGLDQVRATPVVLYFDGPGSAAEVLPFVNRQVPPEARMIPDHLREEWFGAIDAAGERGEFLAVLTMWVACGIRPARG